MLDAYCVVRDIYALNTNIIYNIVDSHHNNLNVK